VNQYISTYVRDQLFHPPAILGRKLGNLFWFFLAGRKFLDRKGIFSTLESHSVVSTTAKLAIAIAVAYEALLLSVRVHVSSVLEGTRNVLAGLSWFPILHCAMT
jgi:hypothetical protein